MPGDQSKTQPAKAGEANRPALSGESRAPLVRAPLDRAIAWIDARAARLGPEEIGLDEATGRVVASELQATAPLPPSDCAAADGYAIRAADTVGASDYNPLSFVLCSPQHADSGRAGGPAEPGEALRPNEPTTGSLGSVLPPFSAAPIVAGAAVPPGADAVLPHDLAQASAAPSTEKISAGKTIEVFGPVPHGWGILRKGQQAPSGTSLLEAGRVLLPQHIGLLASSAIRRVEVVRRPRVRLFVFPPKSTAASGDANSPMLRMLIHRDGGVVVETKLSETPSPKALAETLARALTSGKADLILVAGRSGHGLDDFALQAIAESGEVAIHGVALRPGGSASMGVAHGTPVLLLPGDPLECWSAYEMLAGRLIRRMAGRSLELPYTKQQAEVGHRIVSAIGVVDLCRVCLSQPRDAQPRDAQGKIEPVGPAESGGLASAARADGFVLVPAPLEGFAPGTRVDVFLFEGNSVTRNQL